jgi:hypothetical protein
MRALITYDRYTELLGKRIHRTITPAELEAVARFEAAQPKTCPKCNTLLHSYFLPTQIIHDVDKCPGKSAVTDAKP